MPMWSQTSKTFQAKIVMESTRGTLSAPSRTSQSVTIMHHNLQCATDLLRMLIHWWKVDGPRLPRCKKRSKAYSKKSLKLMTTLTQWWPSIKNFLHEQISRSQLGSLAKMMTSTASLLVNHCLRWKKRPIWSWSGKKQIQSMVFARWICSSKRKGELLKLWMRMR